MICRTEKGGLLEKRITAYVVSWMVFVGSLFSSGALLFSEIIVTGEHSYTMLQILQDMGRGTITREAVLGTDSILRNAFSGYTSLLVPVVAALPMIRLLYIENRSGYKPVLHEQKIPQEILLG